MKLPNRTDTNIYECKSSLFLSASTEVKKCTTWTVKFVVNELLPTHLHYLGKYLSHPVQPICLRAIYIGGANLFEKRGLATASYL